ncbi:hypothetical protein SO802_010230 [Lithocarpus litseifolius]|uniref:CCHC-type domain-containing protein n=1 Tax=Lithocarpus litseifolius TaxID=425828 RepID=A0AAW2DGA5_9ROSI
MWVQVWGLPFDLINEEAGLDIGRGIGSVVEVDCRALASDQARLLRIRVEVPLDQPLRRGGQIVSLEGDRVRVAYRYERLVGLCFQCGRVGHEATRCTHPHDETTQSRPYGDWLRAGIKTRTDGSRGRTDSPPHRSTAQPSPARVTGNPPVTGEDVDPNTRI